MKDKLKCCLLILVIATAALGLRLPKLAERPMHGDEAIHAVKFGELLEKGTYKYDSSDYHGPSLNYLTLIPAELFGQKNLKQVTELTLRIVPVACGILLILLLMLLIDELGTGAILAAGILTAISPAMVFYSRYYIQEMLLVCFTFGLMVTAYRYVKSKNILWIIPAGIFAGLMHATKETCIIAFGSLLLAILILSLIHRGQNKFSVKPAHIIFGILIAGFVSAIFYSSFFTNPAGIAESYKALVPYFTKASENKLHIHPWYYYLQLLTYFKFGTGPVFSEALILLLAVIGFDAAFSRKFITGIDVTLARFVALYTLIMIIIYSAIPYKTPWCLLGFLHGLILLAGIGAAAIFKAMNSTFGKAAVVIVLIAGGLILSWECFLVNFRFFAEPVNPYVYAHPTRDVIAIAKSVEQIAKQTGQGDNLYIQVICTDNDYWPLPWYLRNFNHVGWWSKVDLETPAAPVIIATADLEQEVLKLIYEVPPPGKRDLYVPLFENRMFLRPNLELLGFVKAGFNK